MADCAFCCSCVYGSTDGWRWTLTWLEGRPVVELDDGTVIRVDHEGAVLVEDPD